MTKRFIPPKRKQFNQINLSRSTKQILLGSLLGDGSLKIAKNYKNARFCEKHSTVQLEYLDWKFSQLEPELKGRIIISEPTSSSFSKKKKVLYQSRVSNELTILHHLTHTRNKKTIKRSWLNNLDALGLATWWCDDGSLNVATQQGVICTDCFTRAEHLILARYLEIDWKIHCKIIDRPIKNKNKALIRTDYRLRFSNIKEFKAFLRIILPHIPVASMIYKVMICFKDPQDQQRWISEVKNALPQFESEISTIYEIPFQRYGDLVEKNRKLTFRDIFYKTPKFVSILKG
uniref:Putative LAGLIDADG homing endonuclease n=1 Tax=Neodangemannia microcystis TaxID=173495 RepID=A0A1W6EHF5_9CHLO|nr:putative LAGLIDADG homing endonuclease [Neodangemannia microcystis]YP_009367836.1 putative LAGLIDADG homing endonuclease [Neodangemannia microcystis]ARK14803.1 putative LAGLIDADG homing endonuclease [Neodangemannia microcystis]ARK14807.1 putative LAGLIDADG homing endonuclease [Neodangemannia microcystis]